MCTKMKSINAETVEKRLRKKKTSRPRLEMEDVELVSQGFSMLFALVFNEIQRRNNITIGQNKSKHQRIYQLGAYGRVFWS